MARVTLQHIAERAGVSVASVSNVLNGRTEKVTANTAEKIINCARALGYQKSVITTPANAEFSRDIWVLMPNESNDLPDVNLLQDSPFFNDFIAGIDKGTSIYGLSFTFKRIQSEDEISTLAKQKPPLGVIILGAFPPAIEQVIAQWSFNTVVVDNAQFFDQHQASKNIRRAELNDATLGELAIEHLAKLGHRHIALVFGYLDQSTVHSERYRGVSEWAANANEDFKLPLIETDVFFSDAEAQFAKIQAAISDGASAVLCMSDIFALSVYREAHKCGFNIPYNFSLIGMDNLKLLNFLPFQLTTVNQHIVRRGYNTVMQLLEGGKPLAVKLEIIAGDTCRSIN